jgi:hypothetical protein
MLSILFAKPGRLLQDDSILKVRFQVGLTVGSPGRWQWVMLCVFLMDRIQSLISLFESSTGPYRSRGRIRVEHS